MVKRNVLIIVVTIFAQLCIAQIQLPTYIPSTPLNYVRSRDAWIPITSAATLTTSPIKDVVQTAQYVDGLGRPFQTVD